MPWPWSTATTATEPKNTGFNPALPSNNSNNSRLPYPFPTPHQASDPFLDCLSRMSESEKTLEIWQKKIADVTDKIKSPNPVSPRVKYARLNRFLEKAITTSSGQVKKEEKVDEKTALKSSIFSVDAIDEVMANTVNETSKSFDELEKLNRLSLQENSQEKILKQSFLIQEIRQKYQAMFNNIKIILLGWREAEEVLKVVMQDLKLGALSEVTQELVDRWLYDKIQESTTILFDLECKLLRDLMRVETTSKKWIAFNCEEEKYIKPSQKKTSEASTQTTSLSFLAKPLQIDTSFEEEGSTKSLKV